MYYFHDFNYVKKRRYHRFTHICIVPSRYNLAYSSGSSIASAFNAQSDPLSEKEPYTNKSAKLMSISILQTQTYNLFTRGLRLLHTQGICPKTPAACPSRYTCHDLTLEIQCSHT